MASTVPASELAKFVASSIRSGGAAKLAGDYDSAVRELYNAQRLLLVLPPLSRLAGEVIIRGQNYGMAVRQLGEGNHTGTAISIAKNYVAALLADAMQQLQSEKQRANDIVSVFGRLKALDQSLERHSRFQVPRGDGEGKGEGRNGGASAQLPAAESGAGESSGASKPAASRTAKTSGGGGGSGSRAKAAVPASGGGGGDDDVDTGVAGSKSFEAKIAAFKTLEMTEDNCVMFGDLVGVQGIEQAIKDSVVNAMLYPKLFPKQTKGLMLYGPPGTGKTQVVKAAATELRLKLAEAQAGEKHITKVGVMNASGGQLTGKFVGESEKLVEAMWTAAERFSHTGENRELEDDEQSQQNVTIIFLDEAESVLSDRSTAGDSAGAQVSASIVNTFLAQMDGLRDRKGARIFFIAATNYPNKIDGAIMRRFKKRVFFDLPENADRAEMVHNAIADLARNLAIPVRVQTGPVKAKCERQEAAFQPFLPLANGSPSAFQELVMGQKTHAEMTIQALKGLVVPVHGVNGETDEDELALIQKVHDQDELLGDQRRKLRQEYSNPRTMAAMNFSHSDVANAMRTLFENIGSGTLSTGIAVLRAMPLQPDFWPKIFPEALTEENQVRHLIFTEYDERLKQDQHAIGAFLSPPSAEEAETPAGGDTDSDQGKGTQGGRGGAAAAAVRVPVQTPSFMAPFALTEIEWDPYDKRIFLYRKQLARKTQTVVDVARTIMVLDLKGMAKLKAEREIIFVQSCIDLPKAQINVREMTVDRRTMLQPESTGSSVAAISQGETETPPSLHTMRRLLIVSDVNRLDSKVTWEQDAATYLTSVADKAPVLYRNLQFVVCTRAEDVHLHLKMLTSTDFGVPVLPFNAQALVQKPGSGGHSNAGGVEGVFTGTHAWAVIAGSAKRSGMHWLQGIRRGVGPGAMPALKTRLNESTKGGKILLMGKLQVTVASSGLKSQVNVAVSVPAALNLFAKGADLDAGSYDAITGITMGEHTEAIPISTSAELMQPEYIRAGLREQFLDRFHSHVKGSAMAKRLSSTDVNPTVYVQLASVGGKYVALPPDSAQYKTIRAKLQDDGSTPLTLDTVLKGDGDAVAQWFGLDVMTSKGEVVTTTLATLHHPKATAQERLMLRPARIDTHRIAQLKLQMQPSFNENAYGATALFAIDSRSLAGIEQLHIDDSSDLDLPVIRGISDKDPQPDVEEEAALEAFHRQGQNPNPSVAAASGAGADQLQLV